MDESDVGIREFLRPGPGFTAIIKHRFADFIVREVRLDQRVCRLRVRASRAADTLPSPAGPAGVERDATEDAARATLADSLSEAERAVLAELARASGAADASARAGEVVLSVHDDKATRTAVHKAIRALYPGLCSETRGEDKSIVVQSVKGGPRGGGGGGGGGGNKRRRVDPWPGGDLHFLSFTLLKENRDTMDALETLAKALHVKPSTFSYAGVKDRRAVTAQEVRAYRLDPSRLGGFQDASAAGRDTLSVGDLEFARDALKLGDLAGNRFTIVLRDVAVHALPCALAGVAAVRARGCINYYGLQRFGNNAAAPTHRIGAALLTGRLRDAIELILAPRAGERADVAAARQTYAQSRDAAKALAQMPNFMHRERSLLQGLATPHGARDLAATLARVPRNVRKLYLHGYQSYVWNCMASERIRLYGADAPVPGDLVLLERAAPSAAASAPAAGDGGSAEAAAIGGAAAGEGELLCPVRALSADECASGRYSLRDVVLPLPGTDVRYPTNELGQKYHALMRADGLDPADMERRVKEYQLSGAYRKLLLQPEDVQHAVLAYPADEPDCQLTETELDESRGVAVGGTVLTPEDPRLAPPPPGEADEARAAGCAAGADSASDAPAAAAACKYALRVEFTLPPGAYATMALRELCKQSTEVDRQAQLSKGQGERSLGTTNVSDEAAAAAPAVTQDSQ